MYHQKQNIMGASREKERKKTLFYLQIINVYKQTNNEFGIQKL